MPEQPKYQWSCFTSLDRLEQFVVRSDNQQEFVEAIHFVVSIFLQGRPQLSELDQEPEIPPDQCALHNVTMQKRISTNGVIHWYEHQWQQENIWYVCNGKIVKKQSLEQ